MPYRRTYRRYRRPYRKSYKQSKSNKYLSYASTAIKALSLAKYAVSVLNPEKKIFDIGATGSALDTGSIYLLTGIAQGITNSTRNGNSIKAATNQFRCIFSLNASSTRFDNLCRIMLFIDTNQDENGSNPQVTDVLASAQVNSPLNNLRIGRFKILADRIVKLNGVGAGQTVRQVNIFHKLHHHLRYSGDYTGSPANLRQGQVYALVMSNQSVNRPTFDIINRFKFYDN